MTQNLRTLPRFDIPNALAEYGRDPLGFMTRCAREFGPKASGLVPLRFEGELFCLLTNPAHITEMLKDRRLFIKAKDLRILKDLLGNGLLTSEGDFWQRQRRLVQPLFHHQRIHSYGTVMVNYTARMLQTWHEGECLNVHDEMTRLTLNIVMKTIFDQDISGEAAGNIAQAVDEVMAWYSYQEEDSGSAQAWIDRSLQAVGQALQNWGSSRDTEDRYREAIALLDKTVYAMIAHRRTTRSAGDDLLGMLMQVQDADDGSQMSDQQLRDEAITMIIAGHETTANTLSWTWMLLANHPRVQEKLAAELKAVLAGRLPTVADLPQLPYTSWIIQEAMRLYPPVIDVSREATKDCAIGDYAIPKGTTLIASQWVMHRDPRYFEDPAAFQPERWANDLESRLPRGVYFPFSDGPRVCIGKSFALMEAVLILATISQQFQLALVPGQAITLQPSITLRPKHGIQVTLQKSRNC